MQRAALVAGEEGILTHTMPAGSPRMWKACMGISQGITEILRFCPPTRFPLTANRSRLSGRW